MARFAPRFSSSRIQLEPCQASHRPTVRSEISRTEVRQPSAIGKRARNSTVNYSRGLMSPVQTLLRWRLLILAWLIAWITTVPFFHLHIPDSTDRWSALHSGGAHTVLTPDLPGEFSHPLNDKQGGHSGHLSPRGVHSPELGIALFDEKSDDRKAKERHSVTVPDRFAATAWLSSVVFEDPGQFPKVHFPYAVPPTRAPPHTV